MTSRIIKTVLLYFAFYQSYFLESNVTGSKMFWDFFRFSKYVILDFIIKFEKYNKVSKEYLLHLFS